MTIEPGARLGHYQVVEAIGAGGMGEVYRARDLKLGREVAIKVLPEALSKEDERLARFEREAKLLAQLNHPGIATLHGLEEHDGLEFLVMELVEGETLADRLRRGPIPLESALPLFCQIAEALDAAHDKGVLHRDLKPPNIMVTEDENIKILDFGLAKAMVTETETETESPTISRGTETGVVLGTPAYMSPEQARGLSLDERSDIWSFGCVLYETLTGRTCFGGNTVSDTIASILKESPQWDGLPTTTPKALERLLRRCLQKDPRQRLRDIGDARLDIQEILDQPDLASVDMPTRPRPSMIPWAVSAVLLTVIIFLVFVGTESGDRERLQVVSVATPPGTNVQTVVVSPDGSALAIVAAEREGSTSLWVRDLDSATARRLPGTEGAAYPFWSPDGRNLGFFSGSQLNKTVAQGGPVEALAEVPSARGGSWGPSGTIVFTMAGDSTLFRIPETGGEPTPVTVQNPGENSHRYPSFLPDGKHVIYFARNPVSPELGGVWVASLDGNTPPRQLVDAHSLAVYAHPGFLIYRRGENLIAQRFDAGALTFTDDPVPIVDEVWFDPAFSGLANFSASDNGMLAYRGGGIEKTTLTWYDRGGNELEQLGEAANYLNLYLSPGDELVAVSKTNERTESRDLWLIDVEAGTPRQLTFNPATDFAPLWVDDGDTIIFSSDRQGKFDIYELSSIGGAEVKELLVNDNTIWGRHVSPDGNLVIFDSMNPVTADTDIGILNRSTGERTMFRQTDDYDWFGRVSPDGNFLAYSSNELGTYEVFVENLDRSGGRWKLSVDGGFQPVWNPNGRELFYLSRDGSMMAVEVETDGGALRHGAPRTLFHTQVPISSVIQPVSLNHYDVSADGNTFLISTRVEAPSPIMLILNWTALVAE